MICDTIKCNAEVNAESKRILFKENIEGIDEWSHSWYPGQGKISQRLLGYFQNRRDKGFDFR